MTFLSILFTMGVMIPELKKKITSRKSLAVAGFLLVFLLFFGLIIRNRRQWFSKGAQENFSSILSKKNRDDLPWRIYPQATVRVNNKLISSDKSIIFQKGEKIAFDAQLSLQDYRLQTNLEKRTRSGKIPLEEAVPKQEEKKDIKEYLWSFGDGKGFASGEKVDYSYKEEGTYLASLSVQHQNGNNDYESFLIQIGNSSESKKLKTFDFGKYKPKFEEAQSISPIPPPATPDKVAVLIDSDTFAELSRQENLIEGKNPVVLYMDEVERLFPEVDLVLVNDKNWESWDPNCTPQPTCRPEYDIKNTLKNLYEARDPRTGDGRGIKGAILVGLLPYFKWYQQVFSALGGPANDTICNSCYEDFDGQYEDRYFVFRPCWRTSGDPPCREEACGLGSSNNRECDGFLDYVNYTPTGREHLGPEIWVSWIRPLVGFGLTEAPQQLKDFFTKNHNYYLGRVKTDNRPLLMWVLGCGPGANNYGCLWARRALLNYYSETDLVEAGFEGSTEGATRNFWFSHDIERHKFFLLNGHGSPDKVLLADWIISSEEILGLAGRSLATSLISCATANFQASPRKNFQLSLINSSPLGLVSEGVNHVHNFPHRNEITINLWAGGAYYGKAWAEVDKDLAVNSPFGEADKERNLPGYMLFGNPFIRFGYSALPEELKINGAYPQTSYQERQVYVSIFVEDVDEIAYQMDDGAWQTIRVVRSFDNNSFEKDTNSDGLADGWSKGWSSRDANYRLESGGIFGGLMQTVFLPEAEDTIHQTEQNLEENHSYTLTGFLKIPEGKTVVLDSRDIWRWLRMGVDERESFLQRVGLSSSVADQFRPFIFHFTTKNNIASPGLGYVVGTYFSNYGSEPLGFSLDGVQLFSGEVATSFFVSGATRHKISYYTVKDGARSDTKTWEFSLGSNVSTYNLLNQNPL